MFVTGPCRDRSVRFGLVKGFPHLARYGLYFGLGVSLYYAITGRRVAWVLSGVFCGAMLYDFSIYGVPLGTSRLAMPKVVTQYALFTACAGAIAVLPHLRGSIAAAKRIPHWGISRTHST